MTNSIYDFNVKLLDGDDISLEELKGKVLLIVNTASQCGFTPQHEGLEKLYKKYKDKGLVVLGFPCNQFGTQEPGNAAEIAGFCETNYHISFPLFAKIDVNGKDAHPLYNYLKSQQKGLFGSKAVKWNFTKFLVNRRGEVVERFAPMTTPDAITPAIERLLQES